MKRFHYVNGGEAYLWLHEYEKPHISIDSMEALDKNMEVMLNYKGDVLAYRSDLPDDMRDMVKNYSKWNYTTAAEKLSEHERCMLHLLCREAAWN